MKEEVFVAIMAGGEGERFWPISRQSRPKQFLKLFDDITLLEQTVLRVQRLVDDEHILIITNQRYREQTKQLLTNLPEDNIICEPCSRNTAPCVALALGTVLHRAEAKNAVLVVLPADHYISNAAALVKDLQQAIAAGSQLNKLVTIGVTPTYPCTEYGYIESGDRVSGYAGVFEARSFHEKPALDKAQKMLATGNFKWNAGMFVFPVATLLQELRCHASQIAQLAERIAAIFERSDREELLAQLFADAEKISIDYALMEKTSEIILKEATFAWEDLGNWKSTRNYLKLDENSNVVKGPAALLDCRDCIIYSESDASPLVAGIGLKNMVVASNQDAVLIAPETRLGQIKELLGAMKKQEKFKGHL